MRRLWILLCFACLLMAAQAPQSLALSVALSQSKGPAACTERGTPSRRSEGVDIMLVSARWGEVCSP